MALYNDIKHAFYANIHLKKGTTSGHETEVCAMLETIYAKKKKTFKVCFSQFLNNNNNNSFKSKVHFI